VRRGGAVRFAAFIDKMPLCTAVYSIQLYVLQLAVLSYV
jgi:hypothetical protein